ncbi:MAG: K+/H+ antiporter subunit F [Burkholderiales bacterium]|jgi:multicomponent K+:H+ antiporter subunit F
MMKTLFNTSAHLGTFSQYAVTIAMGAFAIALLLNLYRLIRGPSTTDRILALDTAYINVLALTLLSGIVSASSVFFEVALVIAMLGFIGTVVMAKFLDRGDIVQ